MYILSKGLYLKKCIIYEYEPDAMNRKMGDLKKKMGFFGIIAINWKLKGHIHTIDLGIKTISFWIFLFKKRKEKWIKQLFNIRLIRETCKICV